MKLFTTRIKTDSGNRLVIYNYSDEVKGERKLVTDGVWSLTPEHNLKFHILGSDNPLAGKTLIFRGDIERVKAGFLAFRIREHENVLGVRSGTISLKGKWEADKYNRITFDVIKGEGRYDTLTFQGAWNVNRSNEVVYKYRKTQLKTKEREEKILIFRGHWELERARIKYKVEHSSDSSFDFRAVLQSKKLSGRSRELKYTVGITYSRGRAFRKVQRIVTIYGNWRLDKDLKVSYEVTYSRGDLRKIEFGVYKLVGDSSELSLFLADKKGKDLGVRVEFNKAFSDDAELFCALSRMGKEFKVTGGVNIGF